MCISHNSFIRGFNSIYQQAPRLKKSDYPDFITYSLAWHRLVEEHHRYEETGLFLEIDKATGQKGVMGKEVEQHGGSRINNAKMRDARLTILCTAAFHDGLDAFKAYLVGLKGKEGEFSFARLIEIMDSFSQPLYTHLSEELDSIVNLSRFSTPDNPIDIVAIALKVGKQAVTRDFALNCLPCFILNMEAVEFEGGMWQEFPPVNAPVRFVLLRVLPLWRRAVWRFASCGENRARKQLAV